MGKLIEKNHTYQCGECKEGTINAKHTFDGEMNTLYIKRCNKCKKQYEVEDFINLIKLDGI